MALPTKKRLWQQIVQEKIRNQTRVLESIHQADAGLSDLVPRVLSGDTTNVEAQASRIYWQALFSFPGFRRRQTAEGENVFLNYGYTVLRAVIVRAICATGLHPSFGVHHHNKYNPFCLADDLMEPYRPWVDYIVATFVQAQPDEKALTPEVKKELMKILACQFLIDKEWHTLFNAAHKTSHSVLRWIESPKDGVLHLPKFSLESFNV